MGELVSIFLVMLAVSLILTGPAALIISIIALKRTQQPGSGIKPQVNKTIYQPLPVQQQPIPSTKPTTTLQVQTTPKQKTESVTGNSIEQQIGTRWVLFAGIITVIIGVGFFMKYAYDNALIGPLGRVIIAIVAGLAALFIGEITRKRGFGLVAKSVTALGFAILYAAVFSAYRFYGLIDMTPAFILTILITIASMLYAVSLNENIIAVLSLLGGFSAPLLITTGENMPFAVFSYILILGAGAMLCAFYRQWRLVNLTSFILTIVTYFIWLNQFFLREAPLSDARLQQMPAAITWLTIFFTLYLILPLLNGFVRRCQAQKADIILVISNAAVTFLLLWLILFTNYRTAMAFSTIGLCLAHLLIMKAVTSRSKQDTNLQLSLLIIGLLFLTITIPIYFKLYAVAILWALEAVAITVVGIRYKSIWTQASGIIILALSIVQLLIQLPMHRAAFTLVFNPAFGSWALVGLSIIICHILHRKMNNTYNYMREIVSGHLYYIAVILLGIACIVEWNHHCDFNILSGHTSNFIKGVILIAAAMLIPFVLRPLSPLGKLPKIFATIIAIAGSLFTIIAFTEIYNNSFTIFVNSNFFIALIFVGSLALTCYLLSKNLEQDKSDTIFYNIIGITAIFTLWVLLSEEIHLYWYCKNRFIETIGNWRFLSNMYISVMWAIYGAALMGVGFCFKKTGIRYIALGLFAALLIKVFILDMSTVKSVYKIAAFLATGLTLVAVSYLYQHLKNKGFFDLIGTENQSKTQE